MPFNGKIAPGTHALAVVQDGLKPRKSTSLSKKVKNMSMVSLIESQKEWRGCHRDHFSRCDPAKDAFCQRYCSEQPGRRINLDGFYIDKTEVTVADYQRCVAAGKCIPKVEQLHGASQSTRVPSYVYSEMQLESKRTRQTPLELCDLVRGEQYCQWQGNICLPKPSGKSGSRHDRFIIPMW